MKLMRHIPGKCTTVASKHAQELQTLMSILILRNNDKKCFYITLHYKSNGQMLRSKDALNAMFNLHGMQATYHVGHLGLTSCVNQCQYNGGAENAGVEKSAR